MTITTAQANLDKPLVFLVSSYDNFNNLLLNSLNQYCTVFFVNENNWKFLTETLRNNSQNSRFYVIFLIGETDDLKRKEIQVLDLLESSKGKNVKSLFLFPLNVYETNSKYFEKIAKTILNQSLNYCGVVYSGEILEDVETVFNVIYKNKKIILPASPYILSPLSLKSLTSFVTSSLFSMKAYKVSSLVLGEEISQNELIAYLKNSMPSLKIEFKSETVVKTHTSNFNLVRFGENKNDILQAFVKNIKTLNVNTNNKPNIWDLALNINTISNNAIKKIYKLSESSFSSVFKNIRNFRISKPKKYSKKAISNTNRLLKTRNKFKYAGFIIFVSLVIIIFPAFLLLLSYFSFYVSSYLIQNGDITLGKNFLNISNSLNSNSKNYSHFFTDRNIFYNYYQNYVNKTARLEQKNGVQAKIVNVIGILTANKNEYSNVNYYSDLAVELDSLYNEIGFLDGEMGGEGTVKSPIFDFATFGEARKKVLLFSKLINEIKSQYATGKAINYLIILQDNNELRASGGKIKAFSVVATTGTENLSISDYGIISTDSKLTGQVEPPFALRKYFKKDRWLLSESNWETDFAAASEQIKWFLDKEIDMNFNAVIAIDTKALKDVVNIIDPKTSSTISISDNEELNTEYIRLFTKAIMKKDINSKTKIKRINTLIDLLNSKNMLISSDNLAVNDVLSDLGWSGRLTNTECSSCYSDIAGISESAITSGSQNIIREAILNISFEENLIKREATYFFENRNDKTYEAYLRFIVNGDAGLSPATIISNNNEEVKSFEVTGRGAIKEGGVYFSLKPAETKAVKFIWESGSYNFQNNKEYHLHYRKQPGVYDYPLEIKIQTPGNLKLKPITPPSLTNKDLFIYNTKLVNDFVVESNIYQ